jgi:type I restriction enzyme S subunit
MSLETCWATRSLGDIADFINGDRGKNYPTSSDYVGSGIPFVSASDLDGRSVNLSGATFISEVAYDRLGNGKIIEGDILFCLRGSLGKIGLAKGIAKGAIASSLVIIRPKEGVSLDFLFYILSGSTGKSIARELDNGSVQGNLSVRELKQVEVELPGHQEQKAIAHILGTLDEKIELNRKTNETLEAMAKALFKSWFVDFDPVKAKAEGRPTGLPAEISDLFPDSFEDSELGEIPTGWRVGTIASSVGEVFDGPHATPKEADEGNVFLGIKNMTGSSLDLSDVKLIGHDDWSQWTRRVEPKATDIVFTYEAALGLFAVIPHGLKCCLGRRMALIRTKATNGTPHFWFHQFIAKPFQKVIEERSIHGATVNRTPLTEFPGYPILEPPDTLRLVFDYAASSLWARIHAASNQTASLTALRDTLLPKLISGELRIPDTEKMLEEVGI